LVQNALRDFIREKINARLQSAIEGGFSSLEVADPKGAALEVDEDGIETTPEEIEAFHIVRAILAKYTPAKRIVMRDTKSYCGVLLDDNNRKPVCRLRFNHNQKYLGLFDAAKNETKLPITSPSDIYIHESALIETLKSYETNKDESTAAHEQDVT